MPLSLNHSNAQFGILTRPNFPNIQFYPVSCNEDSLETADLQIYFFSPSRHYYLFTTVDNRDYTEGVMSICVLM